MASDRAVKAALVSICTAARVAEGLNDEAVYRRALKDVDDTELADAALHVVRTQRWEFGLKPSPALLLDAVRNVRARSAAREREAKPKGPVTPIDELSARVAHVRATAFRKETP